MTEIAPVIASTNIDRPNIECAGVAAGRKILVGDPPSKASANSLNERWTSIAPPNPTAPSGRSNVTSKLNSYLASFIPSIRIVVGLFDPLLDTFDWLHRMSTRWDDCPARLRESGYC